MTRDSHKIFEAYAAPVTAASAAAKPTIAAPPVRAQTNSLPPPVNSAPQPAPQAATTNTQTPLSLKLPIDTERKAQHAAFDILEHIYSNVPNFATATSIVAEIVRVHRREAKRQAKLG